MSKKILALLLLILALAFREKLWAMTPFHEESFSLLGLMIALVAGGIALFVVFTLIISLRIRDVWALGTIVIVVANLAAVFGHWLGSFDSIGEFWGGFVTGTVETATLYAVLYGAKEVWTTSKK